MPTPEQTAQNTALINAGAGIVQSGINAGSQASTNQSQMNFSNMMSNRQREWAIQDRDYQNFYNSPQEVMRRYKEAGLNPNLIYGQGTISKSEQPRAVNAPSYNPIAPKIDLSSIGDSVNTYYNVLRQKAELANIEAQNKQIQAQTNYLQFKALTEGTLPDYYKSKTGLTDAQKRTEWYRQNNLDASTQNLIESAYQKKTQTQQLIDIFPIMKKVKLNMAENLLAQTENAKARTNSINTMLQPNKDLVLAKILSEGAKQSKDFASVKMYADLQKKLQNDATQTESTNEINIGGFKFGRTSKTKGELEKLDQKLNSGQKLTQEEMQKLLMQQIKNAKLKY
jgi:hypothetical protein